MHPDHTPGDALQVIDSEFQKIKQGDISEAELAKAVKQARALFAYGCENITNQAYWLGYSEMFDSYKWFENFLPSLEKVTREDVIQAANRYFADNQRVIGIYSPNPKGHTRTEGSDQ